MFEQLFTPCKIGNCEIKNRFVKSPMGTGHYDKDGNVTPSMAEYFAAAAKGGYGLIVVGDIAVSHDGRCDFTQPELGEDKFISDLKHVTDRSHEYGAKMFAQLIYGGRQASSEFTGRRTVAPSAVPCPVGHEPVRAVSEQEIYEIIDAFGDAAVRAQKAGFDGVEIQANHGYFVAEFLSGYVNRRTDAFGGDILGRTRIVKLIVENVKHKCGADYPVTLRISGDEFVAEGRKIEETVAMARLLESYGVDAISVSCGVYASMQYQIAPSNLPQGFMISHAKRIKEAVNIPVMIVGRITDPVTANYAVESGSADFVVQGRASLADPAFPNKVKDNKTDEIFPCVGCMTRCMGDSQIAPTEQFITNCMINPFNGHELEFSIHEAENPKNVVVVGAGPGGMYAAWVAAACGHSVTLLEKNDTFGGQVLAACMPPFKAELSKTIKVLHVMCKKYGVDMHFGVEANADTVLKHKPDVVILATGATPIVPNFENDGIDVVTAFDVLTGKELVDENNLIVGGGMVGLETALYTVSQMRRATVVEMGPEAGADMFISTKIFTDKELREGGVDVLTGTKVVKLTKDGAVCQGSEGEFTLSGFDKVIMAIGSRSVNALEAELTEKVDNVYVVGDAVKPRRIWCAIEEAAKLAVSL